MSNINLQEPQRNRNANANFVNLIRTSTVPTYSKFTTERCKSVVCVSQFDLHRVKRCIAHGRNDINCDDVTINNTMSWWKIAYFATLRS